MFLYFTINLKRSMFLFFCIVFVILNVCNIDGQTKNINQADYSVTKTYSQEPSDTFGNSYYTITVRNTGPVVVNNVEVTDLLDPDVKYVSSSVIDNNGANSWISAISGQKLAFSTAYLNVAESVNITVNVKRMPTAPVTRSTHPVEAEAAQEGISYRVYPNPFSNIITFEIGMTYDSQVRIEIFFNNGTPLSVILDENLMRGDIRKVEFNGSRYLHTVFMYRITTRREQLSGMVMKTK